MSRVVRVTQSPMNAMRWCLELDCGHEAWCTSKRKPTRKIEPCETCLAQKRAAMEKE